MGSLHFIYGTAKAGKSTLLLKEARALLDEGVRVHLMTSALGEGSGQIASRMGTGMPASTFAAGMDLYGYLEKLVTSKPVTLFVDDAHFLSKDQAWQLARAADDYSFTIRAYGLRTDFRGELFAGSAALLAIADEFREVRQLCWCGKPATMVIRQSADGTALTWGDQLSLERTGSGMSYQVFYFSTQTPISPICRTPLFPISQNFNSSLGAEPVPSALPRGDRRYAAGG
tara:strand:- start:1240 stop:1926 length:687 start_codon:yes stop_codon:yes gene_type:complete